jgi:hypothetical protein
VGHIVLEYNVRGVGHIVESAFLVQVSLFYKIITSFVADDADDDDDDDDDLLYSSLMLERAQLAATTTRHGAFIVHIDSLVYGAHGYAGSSAKLLVHVPHRSLCLRSFFPLF